jgi:hypothetical protein
MSLITPEEKLDTSAREPTPEGAAPPKPGRIKLSRTKDPVPGAYNVLISSSFAVGLRAVIDYMKFHLEAGLPPMLFSSLG